MTTGTAVGTDQDLPIGRRIAAARRERGITQQRLAAMIGYSYSYLTKVESGGKDATPALITAAARVLGVSRAELQGQPYRHGSLSSDRVHQMVVPLRRELAVYAVPPAEDGPVLPEHELRAHVERLAVLRHAVNLAKLGEELPPALAGLRLAVHDAPEGPARERLFGLLAEAYAAASQFAYKLGHIDLSSIAVDRYEWAAARSGDPLAVAVGVYQRAGELLNVGEYEAAEAHLEASRRSLETDLDGDPAAWSTWGNLHLKSALVAARQGRADRVWDHHRAAVEAADRNGADRDDYRLAFGPSNTAIWGVGLAVEVGDGAEAVKRGRGLRLSRRVQAERRSHHLIDLARAQIWEGDREGALSSLYAARRAAPQHTRHHPQARETARRLARLEVRAGNRSVAELTHWFRVRP